MSSLSRPLANLPLPSRALFKFSLIDCKGQIKAFQSLGKFGRLFCGQFPPNAPKYICIYFLYLLESSEWEDFSFNIFSHFPLEIAKATMGICNIIEPLTGIKINRFKLPGNTEISCPNLGAILLYIFRREEKGEKYVSQTLQ